MYQSLDQEMKINPSKQVLNPVFLGILLFLLGGTILYLDESAIEVSYVESLSLESLQESVKFSQQCFSTVNVYDNIDLSPESDRKYFLYSPSGGFSNQRTELEYGLLVSKLLGRTLIIPMAGRHTTWWSKYAELTHEDLVPMDFVFDFSQLSNEYDFVFTNKTALELEDFLFKQARDYPNSNTLKLIKPKHRPNWSGEVEIHENLDTEAKLLYLKGSAMYHKWFPSKKKALITSILPFNRCLRNMALDVVQKILGEIGDSDTLNSMHIRLGDYYKHGRVPSVKKLLEKMENNGFKPDDPIYIATEPKRVAKIFRPLEKRYKNIFYSSHFIEIRKQLKRQFPEPVVNDLLGMVEQLICVISKRFIGTSYSNFSSYIDVMRNNSKMIFPELEQAKEQFGLL